MKPSLETKSRSIVEHGAALPLYACELWEVPEDNVVPEGYVGRIIVPGKLKKSAGQTWAMFEPGEYMEAVGGVEHLRKILTEDDILWVPLYEGNLGDPPVWPVRQLPDFDAHMELIAEVGPQAGGILTGNQGPELSFRQDDRDMVQSGNYAARFIRSVATLFEARGVRPVFGPMDRDLAYDCYMDSQHRIRQALCDVGAVGFCFCGFVLTPGTTWDRGNNVLVESAAIIAGYAEGHTVSDLQHYLKGATFWGDIDMDHGLSAGNDVLMAEAGWTAGVY